MRSIERMVASIVVTCSCTVAASPLKAQDEIYVSNHFGNSVTVYERSANGDVAPKRTIVGGSTALDGAEKLSVDPLHAEIFVANEIGATVTVYGLAANGNQAPLRTIAGGNTLLSQPDVPFVDLVHNELFMTSNATGNSEAVRVFSRTATGDVAPIRNLIGGNTQLSDPQGLWVDLVNNELYVANGSNGDKVMVYSRTASGDTAPIRVLTGAATLLGQPEGMVVDTVHNELFVANNVLPSGTGSVTVYSRTANGNVAPIRTIAGANTGFMVVEDLALDLAHDELFVVDEGTNSIRVFSRTANGNVAPIRVISGISTGLDGPQGIRVIPWIFADGFELGDKSRWSSFSP